VAPLDPLLGIWNGLARQPWQPGDPVQRQSLTQLLDGYTRDAAYTEFQEQTKGRLRAGLLADLVLLDHNLFQSPLDALRQVRPVLTMVDGRIVWRTY
jgi:predicted amidohydrolase YtcJ